MIPRSPEELAAYIPIVKRVDARCKAFLSEKEYLIFLTCFQFDESGPVVTDKRRRGIWQLQEKIADDPDIMKLQLLLQQAMADARSQNRSARAAQKRIARRSF